VVEEPEVLSQREHVLCREIGNFSLYLLCYHAFTEEGFIMWKFTKTTPTTTTNTITDTTRVISKESVFGSYSYSKKIWINKTKASFYNE